MQQGISRRGFSRPRWAADQDHAPRIVDGIREDFKIRRTQSQLFDPQAGQYRFEQTESELFSTHRRHRGDTDSDGPITERKFSSSGFGDASRRRIKVGMSLEGA